MLSKNYYAGKLMGIEIYLHWSLALGIFILSLNLCSFFLANVPVIPGVILSVLIIIGLYLSVLAHEFGHIIAARKMGYSAERVYLFVFGGAAIMETFLYKRAGDELVISLWGPIVSFALSIPFILLGLFLPDGYITQFCISIGLINAFLGIFNVLLMTVPADGGRILRSIIWSLTGNWLLATKISCYSFPIVAFVIFAFFTPMTFMNFILFGFLGFLAFAHLPKEGLNYIDALNLPHYMSEGYYSDKEYYVLDQDGKVVGFLRGPKFESV